MKLTHYILFIASNFLFQITLAQNSDSLKSITEISGSLGVTNNGISIVPSFSLGKPAVMFNFNMRKNRFGFEPDLRFSYTGRPWALIFWGRYKILSEGRFLMNAGANLGLNNITSFLTINGAGGETTVVRRYLAGELYPRYLITKNFSLGIYYLYSHGIDVGTFDQTHFITFNANVSNIHLSKEISLRVNPQIYLLKLDKQKGYYVTSSFTLSKQNFPFSLAAIINKTLESNIKGKNLLWNLTLAYSFNHH